MSEALTVKEAAERLHLSAKTVYQLIAAGSIPCRRLGEKRRKILIDAADVVAYWEASKGADRPPGAGREEVTMASRHLRPPVAKITGSRGVRRT